jgi:hypothetical protein
VTPMTKLQISTQRRHFPSEYIVDLYPREHKR